jgi:2-oxoisovalerate ferredoxin oxidoreductase delta subunit
MSETKEKKSPYPVINKLECKACERCILACKKGVLEMSDDVNPRGYHYVIFKGEDCTGCGDCYYTCPEPLAIEVHIPKKAKQNHQKDSQSEEE